MAPKKKSKVKSKKKSAPARKPAKKSKKTEAKSKPRGKKVAKKLKKKKVAARRPRGRSNSVELVSYDQKGLGPVSGGQSGDTQGLSGLAGADSESVAELLEEGQSFEAEVVSGVENVPDADESEIFTREVPEDDVPGEYLEKD